MSVLIKKVQIGCPSNISLHVPERVGCKTSRLGKKSSSADSFLDGSVLEEALIDDVCEFIAAHN